MEAWEEASCRAIFGGHHSPVRSLALNPANTLLVAGCADGVVGVWDVPRRRPLSRLRAHAGAVTAVVLSDQLLFSGSADLTVRVWTLDHLHIQHLATLSSHGSPVHALGLSRDRMLLMGATATSTAVALWDVAQVRARAPTPIS